jgi:RES domain-containing protein
MEVYRITQEKYADDFSGNGARLFGGRWNSEGMYALYTSSSRSLALLEALAHTPAKMLNAKGYILVTLLIPDDVVVEEVLVKDLISGWDAPEAKSFTKERGDRFLRRRAGLLLSVPSVLVPEEENYLLNPLHTDKNRIEKIHERRIYFDQRIM